MTSNLGRRISELEKAAPSDKPAERWPLIAIEDGETEEEVLARYLAENPESRHRPTGLP
jgi:hypothetical protein